MSSQTENPPTWGTEDDYWEWVKERYLSDDPRRFGAVLSGSAERGRASAHARLAGLQDAMVERAAQEYCLRIFRARPTYKAEWPIKPFLDSILARVIREFTSGNGHSEDDPPGLTS